MQGCAIPVLLRWSSQLGVDARAAGSPSRLVFLGQSVGKRPAFALHLHLDFLAAGPLTNTHDRRPQPTAAGLLRYSTIAPPAPSHIQHRYRLLPQAPSAAPPLAHPSPLPTVFAPRISPPFAQQPQRQETRHDRRTTHRRRSRAASRHAASASSHPTRRASFQTGRQCVVVVFAAESPRHCAECPQTSATPSHGAALAQARQP